MVRTIWLMSFIKFQNIVDTIDSKLAVITDSFLTHWKIRKPSTRKDFRVVKDRMGDVEVTTDHEGVKTVLPPIENISLVQTFIPQFA